MLVLTLSFSCTKRNQKDKLENYIKTDNTTISNSYEDFYRKTNPSLKYSYDNISQIHNYSDNWDFDKDGIKDKLYFVGKGGAHLYYFLKVILSTDNKSREYNFIELDSPILTATDTLNFTKTPVGFVVSEYGKNLTPSIIIRLDSNTFSDNKLLLTKMKIKSKNIVLSFDDGNTKFTNL